MNQSWTCKEPYTFFDEIFAKIYSFFVIECPVKNVSVRGITFDERNINLTALNKKIKKLSPDLNDHWYPIKDDDEENVPELLKNNGIFLHKERFQEIAVFTFSKKMRETESFFYCIRCAFAHGGFCIHTHDNYKYYFFENIYNNDELDIVKARIILKEETLLAIVDYCNSKI